MDQTRDRITRAAIELHGTIGPAATTLSAVADRANVTRATLYRHFPNEAALFKACSAEWLAAHPPPDPARWAAIADPDRRLQVALGDVYAYYRSTAAMRANLLRDIAALPAPIAAGVASLPDRLRDGYAAGRPDDADPLQRAALGHAFAFETWRSLVGQGIDDGRAARLMTTLVAGARDRPKPARILLVGMMGAGKTTIGRELARATGWPAADNDDLVHRRTAREPAVIAAVDGEEALHDAEAAALGDALDLAPPLVIGVAGAMVERPEVRERLRDAGHVVWLRARPETLHARIGAGADRRPEAVDRAWLAARASEREALYREVADQIIDVDDLATAEIVTAILDATRVASAG